MYKRQASEWPYPKDQRQSHGMKPVEDPNGKIEVNGKKYRMERFVVEDNRVFSAPKSYLWPILQEELRRCPSPVSYTHLDVYKRQVYPRRF